MTPAEIVSAILDDYLVSRSIDDTELESRLVAALKSYGDERARAEREQVAPVIAAAAASLDATRPIKDRHIALWHALDQYFAAALD